MRFTPRDLEFFCVGAILAVIHPLLAVLGAAYLIWHMSQL